MDILSRYSKSNSLGFRCKSLACLTRHSPGMQLEVTVYLDLLEDGDRAYGNLITKICHIDGLLLLLHMALCDAWPELCMTVVFCSLVWKMYLNK